MNEKLFVYGTLRFPKYQKEAFGQTKKGEPGVLQGYKRGKRKVYGDNYPVILPTKNFSVRGLILTVTPTELKKCDAYEDKMYKRKKVKLKNGIMAWVYALPTG